MAKMDNAMEEKMEPKMPPAAEKKEEGMEKKSPVAKAFKSKMGKMKGKKPLFGGKQAPPFGAK